MKKAARQQQIVATLAESPTIRISHLANALGVSTETVRRDVDELTRRGVVDRTYGFDRLAEAYEYVDSGRKVGNVVVVMPGADEATA